MVNIFQVLTFIEVVNRNSFAAAAQFLKLTPAAVSKHISSLEGSLGVQLLKRSKHQLTLTSAGKIYFQHAKRISNTITEAEAAISESKKEPGGTLKVICGPEFGNLFVLPSLKECLERYPKLELHMMLTQQIPDIENEKVDLILGFLRKSIPPNCIVRCLIYGRDVLCASPLYLNNYGIPKKPADLVHHSIITHTRWSNDTIAFKNGEKIHFKPRLRFNDTRAMKASALNDLGVVLLHDYIVQEELKKGSLVEILPKFMEKVPSIPIYAAYPQTSHVHINTRAYLSFILEKIDNLIV